MSLSVSVSDCVGLISGSSVCVFVCQAFLFVCLSVSVSDCVGLISGRSVCVCLFVYLIVLG